MATRIVASGPKLARPPRLQREPVLILYRFTDLYPFIEVWGRPDRVLVYTAGSLYVPNANLEEERRLEEYLQGELPPFWRRFYLGTEARLLRTENIEARLPSQEFHRLERLRLLDQLPKKVEEWKRQLAVKEDPPSV